MITAILTAILLFVIMAWLVLFALLRIRTDEIEETMFHLFAKELEDKVDTWVRLDAIEKTINNQDKGETK